jgi:hypothetical protein
MIRRRAGYVSFLAFELNGHDFPGVTPASHPICLTKAAANRPDIDPPRMRSRRDRLDEEATGID